MSIRQPEVERSNRCLDQEAAAQQRKGEENKRVVAGAKRQPDLRQGQTVVELGGDGTRLKIIRFRYDINAGVKTEPMADCFVLGTDKIKAFPCTSLKPADAVTLH